MRRNSKIYAGLALGVLSFLLFSCAKKEDVVVLGEFGSLTGGTATFGKSTEEGYRWLWMK